MKLQRCKLGDILSLQRGYDLPETDRRDGDIPVYGSFGITGWHNEARAKGPGLTIGWSGGSMGVVNYCPTDYWPHNAVLFATDFKGNDPRFLSYYLKTIDFKGINSGAAQPSLNRNIAYQLDVVVPEPRAQRRIAEILSAYDDLIENNLRRIALLEESARLLYREWFVRLHFPGHEHTRIVDGVPEGWERTPLEETMILQRGFDLPRQDREEGDIPVYASTGPNGYHSKAMVKGPGVVTGRSGTLGVVHYVSIDFWPLNTTLWVREFRQVSPFYASFLLRTLQLEQYNGGVSVPTLDRKVVHRLPVLLPPAKLIRLFDEQVAPIFAQNEILTLQNQKLKLARDLLLPRLMRGEIAV